MRPIQRYILKSVAIMTIALAISCETEIVKPVLSDDSQFVAPALVNGSSTTAVEFLPQQAANVYEKFDWSKTTYSGLTLATTYVLEADKNVNFSALKVLATTSGNSVSLTVEEINNTMLAMGIPGFTEGTINFRIKSTITGQDNPPLYSAVITRKAKTYQTSECGKYCTVGLIGSASPGGWDNDVDLRLSDATKVDKRTWTTILPLTVGAVKFRAQDGWDVNWGSAAFPTGTGTQNGSDIPIATAGYYRITFNDETGAYTFTALTTPVFATVGIIGSATAGGWDTDTNLTKDGTNAHVWTGTITVVDGDSKFRADDAWTNNWGAATYPSGNANKDGANIPTKAGSYFVRFNDATGEYSFNAQNRATPFTTIGMIGPAQAGGWDSDTDLTKDPSNPYWFSKVLTITAGDAKFRADNAWAANWGFTTFPGGQGVVDGPNIPAKAGTFFIRFNTGTGEYYFLK